MNDTTAQKRHMGTDEDQLMECMEQVRESGLCNMFDRYCVGEVIDEICNESANAEYERVSLSERRGYGKVLSAFAEWKGSAR